MRRISAHIYLIVLMLVALLHGLAYAFVVPVWQMPDEPTLYEYIELITELGRVPQGDDRIPALEADIAASMNRLHFWEYLGFKPEVAPRTLTEAQVRFYMPRQVGIDPPLYFWLAALPLRLARDWLPQDKVMLLRVLSVLLLPCLVACAYGAAREVFPSLHSVPLAVAGLVALQPMFVAVGASLGNDGFANILAALLCWVLLRLLRVGPSLGRVMLVVVLLTLALLVKRTVLPYLVFLGLLGAWWILRRLIAGGRHTARPANSLLARVLPPTKVLHSLWPLVVLLVLIGWGSRQFDWRAAASWLDVRTLRLAERSWADEHSGAALLLHAGDEVMYPLPSAAAHVLQNHSLRYGARVWGDEQATGRLLIYIGDQRQEFPFEVRGVQMPKASVTLSPPVSSLRLGLVADSGRFYADEFWAFGADLPGNLILNSALTIPALQFGSPLHTGASYLRFRDIAWALYSGRPLSSLTFSYQRWAEILFVSFWGHFGWMNVPFVMNSPWMIVLELVCLAGILGTLYWLLQRRGEAWQRRQVWGLVSLVWLTIAVVLLNAYAEPSGLQQGRYLFPEMVPIALLLALGQWALISSTWRRFWLLGWFGFWFTLAGAALVRVISYYGSIV